MIHLWVNTAFMAPHTHLITSSSTTHKGCLFAPSDGICNLTLFVRYQAAPTPKHNEEILLTWKLGDVGALIGL